MPIAYSRSRAMFVAMGVFPAPHFMLYILIFISIFLGLFVLQVYSVLSVIQNFFVI